MSQASGTLRGAGPSTEEADLSRRTWKPSSTKSSSPYVATRVQKSHPCSVSARGTGNLPAEAERLLQVVTQPVPSASGFPSSKSLTSRQRPSGAPHHACPPLVSPEARRGGSGRRSAQRGWVSHPVRQQPSLRRDLLSAHIHLLSTTASCLWPGNSGLARGLGIRISQGAGYIALIKRPPNTPGQRG